MPGSSQQLLKVFFENKKHSDFSKVRMGFFYIFHYYGFSELLAESSFGNYSYVEKVGVCL